jgi:hypothetical protein
MPAAPLQLLVAGPVQSFPLHQYELWQPHDVGVPPAAASLLYAAAWRPLLLLALLLPLALQPLWLGRRSMAHGGVASSASVREWEQQRHQRHPRTITTALTEGGHKKGSRTYMLSDSCNWDQGSVPAAVITTASTRCSFLLGLKTKRS